MFVKCLGSGDAFGSGGRLNTSFFIRSKSKGILLDCGASALVALKKENLAVADIDVILITHLHGDHFGGLAFILCEIIALGNRSKMLTVVGPAETEKRTREALQCFFPGIDLKSDTPVRFFSYAAGKPLEFESVQLTAYPALHSPATHPHSLRLQVDDRVVAYSGDTGWSDELIKVSRDADLFICEASTWKMPVKHHMAVSDLLAQRHRIRAKRIILTHLGDEALNHEDDIPFTIARDGMVLMDE